VWKHNIMRSMQIQSDDLVTRDLANDEDTHLRTGIPVTEASRKAVYQIGSMVYLSRRISRNMLL
jgi:hypothetical protein